jgi:sec-independent protein translocase protein TatA
MFGIGHWELLVIAIIILILFGHRLPSVMFSLGKGIKDFKKGINAQDEEETPAVASDKKE